MGTVILSERPTAESAKSVLKEMGKWQIPITPDNYHVWFEHLVGRNEDLSADIQRTISKEGSFSPDKNRDLYDRHIGCEREHALVRFAQQQTQMILKTVLEEILNARDNSVESGKKFAKYSARLAGVESLSEIQQIVVDLIKDTGSMAESSSRLQARLEKVTHQAEELKKRLLNAQREALTDGLTGLLNRRALERKTERLIEEHGESGNDLSIVLVDIDLFKRFNDRYGHHVGDAVLRFVANSLLDCVKGKDAVGRFGGEEFMVVLPNTSLENACIVAEQLRASVADTKLKLVEMDEEIPAITVSAGVATLGIGESTEAVVKRADSALYAAKSSGRNTVRSEAYKKAG